MFSLMARHTLRFAKFCLKLTACLALITACDEPNLPQIQPKVAKKIPNELTRAIYSAYLQLDPHFIKAVADAAPLRDLLVGLMQFNPQGEVVPALAQSLHSDDGKVWLIHLREDAQWSNGEAVTADDFVASWQRLASPNPPAPLAHYLVYMGLDNAQAVIQGEKPANALGVHALEPYTLRIELQHPNPALPQMLAHVALLPTYQGQAPSVDQPFISNGAYRVQARSKTMLTLTAMQPEQPFKTVHYQLINTAQNPDRFDIVENPLEHYHHNQTELPRLCTYFYEFNFQHPLLSQKAVRQGIRSMISPSEISRDLGIPNHLALPRTMLPDQPQRLNQSSVEQLFAQSGIDAKNPIRLSLTFDEQGQHSQIAQRIARTLGQSDLFRVSLVGVDWKQLLIKRNEKAFDLIRSGWCADYDDPVLFLQPFHSASPDNKSGYANKNVDQWLDKLREPRLPAEQRKQLIHNIVRQLDQDIAILPLFQYQRRMAIAPDIRGIEIGNSSEVIYSKDLYRQ